MNAKKKNKKAHRAPNPNPPQSVENTTKVIENVDQKCEVKQEQILKSETISDLIKTSVSDIKETEITTPKKPKRNKGKKNYEEKEEETIESIQEKNQEVHSESSGKIQECEELTVSKVEAGDEEKPLSDETNVVPSARKKKNKKKTQEKPTGEVNATNEVPIHMSKEQMTDVIEITDAEKKESSALISETQKQDVKKNKNKKKNRTESEKLEKSENALLCTSALQSPLVTDEIHKKEQMSENLQETSGNLSLEIENSEDNYIKIKSFNEMTEIASVEPKDVESKTLLQDISKNKKKNKRDKKLAQDTILDSKSETSQGTSTTKDVMEVRIAISNEPKKDSKESLKTLVCTKGEKYHEKDKSQAQQDTKDKAKTDILDHIPTVQDDTPAQELALEQRKKDVKKILDSHLKNEKEPSTKPKPKIAKPVEKKQNEKQDIQLSENLPNIESLEVSKEDKKESQTLIKTNIQIKQQPTFDIIETQATDHTTAKETSVPEIVENIHVPSDNTMGKKRKKSPKPSKAKKALDIQMLPKQHQSNILPESKEHAIASDMITSNVSIITSQTKVTDLASSSASEAQLLLREDQITDKSVPNLVEKSKDHEGHETKSSKKKKKILPVPPETLEPEIKESSSPAVEKDNHNKTKPTIEEKVEFLEDKRVLADIVVDSLKTDESEASSCDATPDVLFIRSSSQQCLDDNNNTVIQELMHVEEIKLVDPLIIPLIEGSGETPIRTPELITSGIQITELELKAPTEEKTDIKSKMMEVNQDMEELRLSIERSLAEFTALKKCEEEPEKAEKPQLPEKIAFKIDEKNMVEQPFVILPNTGMVPAEIAKHLDTKEPNPSPSSEAVKQTETAPVCPTRKDNKGKSKSKKKGIQEITQATPTASNESTTSQSKDNIKEEKQEKSDQKQEQSSQSSQKGKQQSATTVDEDNTSIPKDIGNDNKQPMYLEPTPDTTVPRELDPIENFEDAMTSSADDINKSFEMIAKEIDDANIENQKKLAANKPVINITDAAEDKNVNKKEKNNPVSQPKNLLGQTDIPVQSHKTDYKKEKNKTPNARQARVKIKDSMDVEKKQSKESQTDVKRSEKEKEKRKNSDKSVKESFSKVNNDNDEYVYKYSFRKVFLQSACYVCNKNLSIMRVPCGYCNLVFYCGAKHKDEDWPQHQALCFAVSTLAHMKDQKHIYADAQNTTGQDYRLLRMQMIVSCEKVLKRRLVPWEQEAMLYPRICAEVSCREWRQGKLKDCVGCGQLSYCIENPSHLPKSHARWCKSYSLYQKLVSYQQTKGRLEPRLPTKIISSEMPAKMNEVLASMYEEKIDINDIQYAALTQLATAPLTAAYCLQLCRRDTGTTNGHRKKQPFTIHVVGAELQFEADALNKWETFFLHLRPDVDELKVVLVSPMLNPGNLPLDLLKRIKLCENCCQNKRRVVFNFEDNKNYHEYRTSDDFINPDIICAFNPSIQRSSVYNGKDPWPSTINCILRLKQPFVITSYTLGELRKDIARIREIADIDFKLVLESGFNSFASVRPDRNFISDDEMPLLFKNYCVAVVLGC